MLFYSDYNDPGNGSSYGGMEVRNNIFYGAAGYTLVVSAASGGKIDIHHSSLKLDGNLYRFGGKGIAWYPRQFNCQIDGADGAAEFAAFQTANAPDVQDARGKRTTAAKSAVFANASARDYQLVAGSPAIDAGVELTTTRSVGSDTTTIPVVRASFFQDGYGGLVAPDQVQVGSNPPVSIVSVDDANNRIVVAQPISFPAGAPVNLPYSGAGPDAGAFEFAAGIPAPSLLSVDPVP